MEGRYPQGVYIILMDCNDTAKEHAFNNWCDNILIPSIEDLPFVRNSLRYKNLLADRPTFEGRPKYLLLSEVFHDDMEEALEGIRKCYALDTINSNGFNAFVTKINTLYSKTGPEFRSERTGRDVQALYCGLLGCSDPSRESEFNKWYDERHSPETIHNDVFCFDTGYRYKIVDPHFPVPHQSTPYLSLYETSEEPLKALDGLRKLRDNSIKLQDTIWIELLNVYYAGLFQPM